MKNNLAKFLAVGSLLVGGSFLATNSARAALLSGSELQFNASLVFYDADAGPGNQLTALFTNTYNDFSSVALIGSYGEFDILGSSNGSFLPYVSAPNPTLEIASIQFPSLIPNVNGGFNQYVGTGGAVASLSGSSLTPNVSPFSTPILRLTDASDPDTPIEFFIDEVTSFFDDVPSNESPFSYTFRATGFFRDAAGVATGRGRLNGTFAFGAPIFVDLTTGSTQTCTGVSDTCVGALTSTFGATFLVDEPIVPVPESSPVSALIGFGLVGSAFALRRKVGLN